MAIIATSLLVLSSPALSQTQDVVVRAALDPASGAIIGQSVSLSVDVLFPETMPRPPRVRIPDVPGAQIMRFESQGVTMRESMGQLNYVGQRFTFAVFPRRGGMLTIPAPEVTLLNAAEDVTGSVKGSPLELNVTVPLGIDASGPVIASNRVTATQSWSPDPTTRFDAGGALVRTITREAADVPALGMPELTFDTPDGVRAYRDPPVSEDRINRGSVTGHRVDKVTYVFEKSGAFTFPDLAQPWWDLGTKSAQSVALPGVSVTILSAPSPAASPGGVWRNPRTWVATIAVLAAFVFTIVLTALHIWPRVRETSLAWRQRSAASEHAARRALRRIARTGDAAATYRAMAEWKSRITPFQAAQIRQHEALQTLSDQLEHSLFGRSSEQWTPELGRRLAQVVSSVPKGRAPIQHSSALLPLNPVGRA